MDLNVSSSAGSSGTALKQLFSWVLFILLAILLFYLFSKPSPGQGQTRTIPLSQFTDLLQQDRIAQVTIGEDELRGQVKAGEAGTKGAEAFAFRTTLPRGTSANWTFTQWLLANGHSAKVVAGHEDNMLTDLLVPLVPWVLIFLFIWFFVFRQLRRKPGDALRLPQPVYLVEQPQGPTDSAASTNSAR